MRKIQTIMWLFLLLVIIFLIYMIFFNNLKETMFVSSIAGSTGRSSMTRGSVSSSMRGAGRGAANQPRYKKKTKI